MKIEMDARDVATLMLALAALRVLLDKDGPRVRGMLANDARNCGVEVPYLDDAGVADVALRISIQAEARS